MKNLILISYISVFLFFTSIRGQWEVLNEGAEFHGIDFINNDVGWILSHDRLLKTENGGLSWNTILLDNNYEFDHIDFINNSIGWAVDKEKGIFKSTDGGYNWKIQYDESVYYTASLYVVNDTTIYVAGYEYEQRLDPLKDRYIGIVLKSKDGGENWEKMVWARTCTKFYSQWFFNSDTGMVTGLDGDPGEGFVIRTNDGGKTWLEDKLPNIRTASDLYFINDSVGFLLGSEENTAHLKKYIYNTTNGGIDWSINYTSEVEILSYFPVDNQTIFTALLDDTSYSLVKSVDGAVTWNHVSSLSEERRGLYFVNENLVFVFGQGYSRSIDGGQNWISEKSFIFPFLDVHFIDSNRGFACGGRSYFAFGSHFEGALFSTKDGGQTWLELPHGLVFKVGFIDPLNGFTLCWGGGGWWPETFIHKTTDGGDTWERINIDLPHSVDFFYDDIGFIDENNLFIVGHYNGWVDSISNGAGIIHSSDGGESGEIIWKQSHTNDYFYEFASIFTIGTKAWAVGPHGLLVYIENIDSIRVYDDLTELWLNRVFFSDEQHGWITSGDSVSTIFNTSDGGQNWNELTTIEYNINDIFFLDSLHGWITGCDSSERGVILKSPDGGRQWNVQVENLSAPLNAITYEDGYLWVVGGNGLILKSDITTDIWVDETNNKVYPSLHSLAQNYPNPFNPTTTIEFSIPKPEFVSLRIYNVLGQEVAILVSENLNAGNYKYSWDASGFASGVYYYQLNTSAGFVHTKKLILLQ